MILGIDTSAYTTSFALVENHTCPAPALDLRSVLDVPLGLRGLRQSDAVFQHVRNFSLMADKLRGQRFDGICVSSRPRPLESSYMPVFTAGEALAAMLASTHNVSLYRVSHQEGHIAAGLWSAGCALDDRPVLALHISGGTSDVLALRRRGDGYRIDELGSSKDLHAGQFVDRVGVALGAAFPAGPVMDRWARQAPQPELRVPSVVKGYEMSFSGPESAVQRLIQAGYPAPAISRAVFICIARTVEKVIRHAWARSTYAYVLLVGGVACNSILREELLKRLPYEIKFANPKYSSDNAVGVALLGCRKRDMEGKKNDKTD